MFDTPNDFPDKINNNKWCSVLIGYIISEVVAAVAEDYNTINILVLSLTNSPEVTTSFLALAAELIQDGLYANTHEAYGKDGAPVDYPVTHVPEPGVRVADPEAVAERV